MEVSHDLGEGQSQSSSLLDELTCVGCGYALRGLSESGVCPECGTSIHQSTRGHLLRFADPAWLGRLKSGTLCLIIYALAIVPISFLGSVLGGAGQQQGGGAVVLQALGILIGAALSVLFLVGTIQVTTQEPRLRDTEDPVTIRMVVRVAAVVGLGGSFLSGIAGLMAMTAYWMPLTITGTLLSLASLVAFIGLFVFYRRLAERVPDTKLVNRTRITMWGILACYGLLILCVVVMLFAGVMAGGVGIMFPLFAMCGIGIALLVFMISTIVLLFKYHAAFGKALADAGDEAELTENEAALGVS